jgi:hypothetical protein
VQSLAPQNLTSADKHLILAGDWNSYMDTERDIYRLDPSDATLLTTGSANQHLRAFLEDLQEADLSLFDPMARDKLTAFNDLHFFPAIKSTVPYPTNCSHLFQLTIANLLVFLSGKILRHLDYLTTVRFSQKSALPAYAADGLNILSHPLPVLESPSMPTILRKRK